MRLRRSLILRGNNPESQDCRHPFFTPNMAKKQPSFIPNQVFVGLPWKTVKPKYEKAISTLQKSFPLHFAIVGRNDGQDALDLFENIKNRIKSSSHAIFDVTGGNANVSLEFGYASGINVSCSIFASNHKAAQNTSKESPIISDLVGQRRVQYKNEAKLLSELKKFCIDHAYTKRFEKALLAANKNKAKGTKKRNRSLALKIVRALDGGQQVRRPDLSQQIEAMGYKQSEIDSMLKFLHQGTIVKCEVGRFSRVYVA